VTVFGLFLTPVFFVTIERLLEKRRMTHLNPPPMSPNPPPMSPNEEPRGA
jgi:hypothetical protein